MRKVICAIYDERPRTCREYPVAGNYRPEACTFWFDDDYERQGECAEECGATCCRMPRRGGEPGGVALPPEAGGLPCKHLVEVEDDGVKVASASPDYEGLIRDVRG